MQRGFIWHLDRTLVKMARGFVIVCFENCRWNWITLEQSPSERVQIAASQELTIAVEERVNMGYGGRID